MFDELDICLFVIMALCGVIMFITGGYDAMAGFVASLVVLVAKTLIETKRTR